jgi:hypothetical protein
MNERIRELWEQCKTPDWHQDNPTYDHEKFAELIVRECIEIVEYKGRKVGTKHPVGFNLMDATWDIKEHFGVEE